MFLSGGSFFSDVTLFVDSARVSSGRGTVSLVMFFSLGVSSL